MPFYPSYKSVLPTQSKNTNTIPEQILTKYNSTTGGNYKTDTLIFLHGLGSTGDAWVNSLEAITEPHVKIVTPTAPKIPVTIKAGESFNAWFDIKSNESSVEEDDQGIKQSRDFVVKLIEEEIASGVLPSRIILGGFSQGGAQALYTGLTCQYKLGGIIALSTWLLLHTSFPEAAAKNLDIHTLQVLLKKV